MCVRTGIDENMSFYIGPDEEGFKAEVTIGGIKHEEIFSTFPQAVDWVEGLRNKEIKKNETERSKEETA